MAEMIFSEEQYLNGNIFQFEERLQSQANRFIENGGLLTTYFNQDDDKTTVDRGTGDIDQLFGTKAPIRYHIIKGLPLYGVGAATPDNTDEAQIEDISVEGDAQILPGTIVPKQYDHFIIDHMKMTALYQVTMVSYDSMKPNGYYKIHYKLFSTSKETIGKLMNQSVDVYHTDMNMIGTSTNPVIREDDYIYKLKIGKMVNAMIMGYRAMFYNERHNCFLYHDQDLGVDIFDMCGNEFMAKHSLMNAYNTSRVIVLTDKLRDSQMPLYYNNSIYQWIELDCPKRMLQKFHYLLGSSTGYPYSSFYHWDDEVSVIQPVANHQADINFEEFSYFDGKQIDALMKDDAEPGNEYEKLLWKFIHKRDTVDIHDVSLYTGDAIMNSINHRDIFLYTPIIIYIIRKLLGMV